MGKNNRRDQRTNYRNSEREFDEMKSRIMNDNQKPNNYSHDRRNSGGYNGGYKKPYEGERKQYGNRQYNSHNDHEREAEPVQTAPEPKIDTFMAMIDELGELVAQQIETSEHPDVVLTVDKNTRKADGGSVYATYTVVPNDGSNRETSIVVYYLEDYSVNAKKAVYMRNYNSCMLVVNKQTSAILFSKFGSGCIEKSKKYIESILNRTIGYFFSDNDAGNYKPTQEPTTADVEELENSCND